MNSVQYHSQAEELMSDAEQLAVSGEARLASVKYLEAASSELDALSFVPSERVRTRGVLAESTAVLCLRAFRSSPDLQVTSRAIQIVSRLVSNLEPEESANVEVQSILSDLLSARTAIMSGVMHSPDGISVTMRGAAIQGALVPLSRVRIVMEQLESLVLRTGEFLASVPFRTRGPVSAQVKRVVVPMIGPASYGSYHFNFYVQGQIPMNLDLDDGWVNPLAVVNLSYAVLHAASLNDEQELVRIVDDDQYRTTMLRIVRNAIPDGRRISEISFARIGASSDVAVFRGDSTRDEITSMIAASSSGHAITRHIGILRALDLDEGWILLVEGGSETKWHASSDYLILDDVIGPFVNQRIRVIGGYDKRRRRNIVRDIILDIDDS